MTATVIALESLFLSDATDLSDYVVVEFDSRAGGLNPGVSVQGEIRRYGDNTLRAVVRRGTAQSYDAQFVADRATTRWVESKVGRLLLVRDPMGRKFYGMFFDVKPVERRGENASDISISVQQSSFSEFV